MQQPVCVCLARAAPPFASVYGPQCKVATSGHREDSGPHLLLPSLKLTTGDLLTQRSRWQQEQYTESSRGACTVVEARKKEQAASHRRQTMSRKSHGNLRDNTHLGVADAVKAEKPDGSSLGSGTMPALFSKSHTCFHEWAQAAAQTLHKVAHFPTPYMHSSAIHPQNTAFLTKLWRKFPILKFWVRMNCPNPHFLGY